MRKTILLSLAICGIHGCAEEPPQPMLPGGLPLTEIDTTPIPGEKKLKQETIDVPEVSKKGPWPKFVAEELTYDFGQMQVGTKLEHRFKIRNEGDAPLLMVAGKSTCKCTKFEVLKPTLEPGEETELHIEWHGKLQDSKFQHGGPVYTNDPKSLERRFVVRGVVDNAYQVMPQETWKVEDVTMSSAGKMRGMLCSRIFEEFKIKDVKCSSPFVTTSVEPMDEETMSKMKALSGYYINVEVSPEMAAGLLKEKLEFVVDQGDTETIVVEIAATREGAVRVLSVKEGVWIASKMGLKLGHFPARNGKEAVMTLAVSKDEMAEQLEIISCKTSPNYMVVELEPSDLTSKTVNRYLLKVRVPAGAPKTRKNSGAPAIVEIETNHPRGEIFKFQVTMNSF